MTETVAFWVITDHPSDYPNSFVVRLQYAVTISENGRIINHGIVYAKECQLAVTLEEARKFVPDGLTNIGRFKDDDPVIAEVWI